MKRKRTIIAARIALSVMIIANMAVIYAFSAESGEKSGERSDNVIESIAGLIIKNYDKLSENEQETIINKLAAPVRKAAHMIEYAALSFLCAALVYTFTDKALIIISVPLIFSFLYALTDELIHQRLTAGRSGQFSDVLIDTAGAALGTLCILLITVLIKNKTRKKSDENYKI